MEILARIEAPLLLGAATAYGAAMLLLWSHLLLRPLEAAPIRAFESASGDQVAPSSSSRAWSPGRYGHYALWLGAVMHLVSIAGQGPTLFTLRAGLAGLLGWFLVVTFLMIGARLGAGSGAIVAPVAFGLTLFSLGAPQLHTWAPSGRLEAFWLACHVIVILAAYVSLAFAFCAALLYLAQEWLLKKRRLRGVWRVLPSLGVADEWIFRATSFGLALLTVGLLTGVAFSAVHEAGYVVWRDPKVLFSSATWAIFALYLASRRWLGWHGRRSNLVIVGGFVVMAFSFLSVPHTVEPS